MCELYFSKIDKSKHFELNDSASIASSGVNGETITVTIDSSGIKPVNSQNSEIGAETLIILGFGAESYVDIQENQ